MSEPSTSPMEQGELEQSPDMMSHLSPDIELVMPEDVISPAPTPTKESGGDAQQALVINDSEDEAFSDEKEDEKEAKPTSSGRGKHHRWEKPLMQRSKNNTSLVTFKICEYYILCYMFQDSAAFLCGVTEMFVQMHFVSITTVAFQPIFSNFDQDELAQCLRQRLHPTDASLTHAQLNATCKDTSMLNITFVSICFSYCSS